MNLRSALTSVLLALVVILALGLVAGQLLGQPLVFGYVETGSMAPTLDPGDGFIALPPSFVGELGPGDVVTFRAEEIQGGGLTTHRIVDETPQGFITQGDANPFTDQDGGEPPVTQTDIVSVAAQFDGQVIEIPFLGVVVGLIEGLLGGLAGLLGGIPLFNRLVDGGLGISMAVLGVLIVGASFVYDLLSSEREGGEHSRSREGVLKFSVIALLLIVVLVLPLTASMVIPSTTHDTTIVSSTSPSESPTVIPVGGSNEINYTASNNGLIPQLIVLTPIDEGVTIENGVMSLAFGQQDTARVTLHAPNETGAYPRMFSERYYAHLLPADVILALHDINPWLAIMAIDLVVVTAALILVILVIGTRPIRMRENRRDVPLTTRIKRFFR